MWNRLKDLQQVIGTLLLSEDIERMLSSCRVGIRSKDDESAFPAEGKTGQ